MRYTPAIGIGLGLVVVLPALGVVATVILWVNLSPDSFRYGMIWLLIGIGVVVFLTRFFRQPLRITLEE